MYNDRNKVRTKIQTVKFNSYEYEQLIDYCNKNNIKIAKLLRNATLSLIRGEEYGKK